MTWCVEDWGAHDAIHGHREGDGAHIGSKAQGCASLLFESQSDDFFLDHMDITT